MITVKAHSTVKKTHRGAVKKSVLRKDSLKWLRALAGK